MPPPSLSFIDPPTPASRISRGARSVGEFSWWVLRRLLGSSLFIWVGLALYVLAGSPGATPGSPHLHGTAQLVAIGFAVLCTCSLYVLWSTQVRPSRA